MDVMEDINIFRAECKKQNIDADKVFLIGRGSKNIGGRYRQSVGIGSQLESHLYVVQFCKDIQVFVAWSLKNIKCNREKYSVKREKLVDIDDSEIHIINKHVEYSGWGDENVIAFKKDAIPQFLQKYVLPTLSACREVTSERNDISFSIKQELGR